MNRRKVREHAFLMLFAIPFHEETEWNEQIVRYGRLHGGIDSEDPQELEDEDYGEISARVQGVIAHLPQIDAALDRISEGWKVARMNKVDLSVLRLAVYEQWYEGLPRGVVINEAVELAKTYGETRSGSFVNGVLAKLPEATEATDGAGGSDA